MGGCIKNTRHGQETVTSVREDRAESSAVKPASAMRAKGGPANQSIPTGLLRHAHATQKHGLALFGVHRLILCFGWVCTYLSCIGRSTYCIRYSSAAFNTLVLL